MKPAFKLILLTCATSLAFSLQARDNPFQSNLNQRDFIDMQDKKPKPFLDSINVKLPSTARELDSIIINYKNIDGSTSTKTIKLDASLDWHYPVRISQDEAIKDIHKRYFNLYKFDFYILKNSIEILSPLKLQRSFLLASPMRIVMDYKRDSKDEFSSSLQTHLQYFSTVSVETHEKFYRVILTLDGQYKHKVTANGNTYKITLQ
ncbi:hypothetical protein BKH43_00695 [Helicobacter sp. 13S00401-1]|uniref:AMIN domain-containing protein n=1 Tax=Helicobacter sp. 13S00401-1 TaxID=1905758 RepID=UPI000BA50F9B|nr:AMIN domain-containing protein [Helicobacter sp. 13S00401-1]PAF51787.1 hypothetical protein BKH43_00695 [Helicobacter sp. 13S00401-1]